MAKNGILVIIISIILLYGCGDNRKGPPSPGFSKNIDDSKKNGVFQFEVVADKSVWLLDSGLQFGIKEAWVENVWDKQVFLIGKTKKLGASSFYQLILNLKIDTLDKGRYYSPPYFFIGNRHLDPFIYLNHQNYFSHQPDTIKVPLYRDTSYYLPSREERKAFDSLILVKRIISR